MSLLVLVLRVLPYHEGRLLFLVNLREKRELLYKLSRPVKLPPSLEYLLCDCHFSRVPAVRLSLLQSTCCETVTQNAHRRPKAKKYKSIQGSQAFKHNHGWKEQCKRTRFGALIIIIKNTLTIFCPVIINLTRSSHEFVYQKYARRTSLRVRKHVTIFSFILTEITK